LLRLAIDDVSRFSRLVLIGIGRNVFTRDGGESSIALAFEREPPPDDVIGRLFLQYSLGAGNDPAALAACLRRIPADFTREEVARVTCPVLVIMGDRDFAGPPEPLVEALPDARLVVLPGVDHFQATREFRCIDATLDFLDASI
jgi:pimeloyl-ACP methyl ester carboxylesterase